MEARAGRRSRHERTWPRRRPTEKGERARKENEEGKRPRHHLYQPNPPIPTNIRRPKRNRPMATHQHTFSPRRRSRTQTHSIRLDSIGLTLMLPQFKLETGLSVPQSRHTLRVGGVSAGRPFAFFATGDFTQIALIHFDSPQHVRPIATFPGAPRSPRPPRSLRLKPVPQIPPNLV